MAALVDEQAGRLIQTLDFMAKKNIPISPQELEGKSAGFFETIKAESDRGCVLVAAAFLDEALELLLRSNMYNDTKLLKKTIDPLFVPVGPLGSLGVKIDLCRALKLLYTEEFEDLISIRNLRNYFAHSYVDASFADQKAIDHILNLNHFGIKNFPLSNEEKKTPNHIRQRFSLCASWLAGGIHKRAGMASVNNKDLE